LVSYASFHSALCRVAAPLIAETHRNSASAAWSGSWLCLQIVASDHQGP